MLTSLSIVLAVAVGIGNADRAKPVEHWRAEAGGYALTFHPGFLSRATIQEPTGELVELYRQDGSFKLPHGDSAAASKHLIRLNGVELDESIAIAIDDPKHEIASIRITMYAKGGLRTLELKNSPTLCPPTCPVEETLCPPTCTKAGDPVFSSRMIADTPRFDAPLTTARAHGYEVSFYGGFASRVTSSVAGELFRQTKPFNLGDAEKAGRHEVRITGGPAQRKVTLGVIDGEHQIANITIDFYGDESIDIKNTAPTCPPLCIE